MGVKPFVVLLSLILVGCSKPAEIPVAPFPIQGSNDVTVSIIGDSYSAGSDEGGKGEQGWPAIVTGQLSTEERAVDPDLLAAGGSGYVTPGPSKKTFVQQAQKTDLTAQLVVFFGGRNDYDDPPEQVAAQAHEAWTAAKTLAPDAKVLIIGPAWSAGPPPPEMVTVRDAVKAQAVKDGLEFVDALDWLQGHPELIGSDGVHPNNAGHQFLASKIAPLISGALPK